MSALGYANRAYISLWSVVFTYAGLVGVDVFFKWMGWGGMVITMLFIFLFLGFFCLMQPAILCAVFLIGNIGDWSVRGGFSTAKVWITKQVPAVMYLVMAIPLTITFLPVEKYFGIAAIGLVVYWVIEMASIRTDSARGLIILRAIYWCIFGYLALAGLYGSAFGQKFINESPSAQQILARYNPFETSKVQAEYDAAMVDVKKERETKLEACFSAGIAKAKKDGNLTDQAVIDRIKDDCNKAAGYVPETKWKQKEIDICYWRNIERVPRGEALTTKLQNAITVGCTKDQKFMRSFDKPPETAHAEGAKRSTRGGPAHSTQANGNFVAATSLDAPKTETTPSRPQNAGVTYGDFMRAKHEYMREINIVLYCKTQECAINKVDALIAAADAYSKTARYVGENPVPADIAEQVRASKSEYIVLATLREQYANANSSAERTAIGVNINELERKLKI